MSNNVLPSNKTSEKNILIMRFVPKVETISEMERQVVHLFKRHVRARTCCQQFFFAPYDAASELGTNSILLHLMLMVDVDGAASLLFPVKGVVWPCMLECAVYRQDKNICA